MLIIIVIIIVFLFLCWKAGGAIFDAFTGTNPDNPSKDTFITHNHHYHDNRSIHYHTNPSEADQKHLHQ